MVLLLSPLLSTWLTLCTFQRRLCQNIATSLHFPFTLWEDRSRKCLPRKSWSPTKISCFWPHLKRTSDYSELENVSASTTTKQPLPKSQDTERASISSSTADNDDERVAAVRQEYKPHVFCEMCERSFKVLSGDNIKSFTFTLAVLRRCMCR